MDRKQNDCVFLSKPLINLWAQIRDLDDPAIAAPLLFIKLMPDTNVDFNYTLVPQPGLNNRVINYVNVHLIYISLVILLTAFFPASRFVTIYVMSSWMLTFAQGGFLAGVLPSTL